MSYSRRDLSILIGAAAASSATAQKAALPS